MNSKHPYKIWKNKKDQYCTYVKINGERKLIRRKTYDILMEYLDDFYGTPDKILKEYQRDSSEYKELKVWNVLEGAYLISQNGDVYSVLSKQWMRPQLHEKTKTYKGQYYILLQDQDHNPRKYSIARLVLATFVGLPPDDMEDPSVDHIDGNSLNNYYKNLRWVEHGVNSALRRNRGIGEKNGRAKLTQEDVIHICNMFVRGGCSIPVIAQQYGVSPRTINSIYQKKNWDYITAWYEFSPNVTQ